MVGIVDVGGGMRCVYSAGVYDCFIDNNIVFPVCVGVSAGSANLISYSCAQRGRTYEFYTKYALRPQFMSMENLRKTGSFIGLDYIYSDLCNTGGEYPLDYEHFVSSGVKLFVGATRACDGEAHFFTNSDIKKDDYNVLKASCCIPAVCKAYKLGSVEYYDGGIASPIPFQKAFDEGCDKVVVVLTKPRENYLVPFGKKVLTNVLLRRTPCMINQIQSLHIRCKKLLEEMDRLEKEGKLLVIEPNECFGVDTLTRNSPNLGALYDEGYEDAKAALNNKFLSELRGAKQ